MGRMSANDMMGQFGGRTSFGVPQVATPAHVPQRGPDQSAVDGQARVGSKTATMDADGDQDNDIMATTGAPRSLGEYAGSTMAPVSLEAMKEQARARGRADMWMPTDTGDRADMSDMRNPKG